MSFTRFYDDDARIQQQMKEMTYVGRYQLDVPGPGAEMPFQDDTHIRMQKWGANLRTNTVNLESDLIGLSRPLQRDNIETNQYKDKKAQTSQITYATNQPFVEESRASHPAWRYRDLEHPRWEMPIINPQANLEKPFHNNIQTRILEKDYYKPSVSVSFDNSRANPTSVDYYLSKH
jgi:hypothetical protein